MSEAYYAKYIVEQDGIFYPTNTEPIICEADPDKSPADNLKEAERLARTACLGHISERPKDKIEYIIFRHTIEEVSRGTYPLTHVNLDSLFPTP